MLVPGVLRRLRLQVGWFEPTWLVFSMKAIRFVMKRVVNDCETGEFQFQSWAFLNAMHFPRGSTVPLHKDQPGHCLIRNQFAQYQVAYDRLVWCLGEVGVRGGVVIE